jgi:hypothetical protein
VHETADELRRLQRLLNDDAAGAGSHLRGIISDERRLRAADPAYAEFRQAMLDEYLPRQGSAFEAWLDAENPLGARIAAEKMFTFQMPDDG